VVVVLVGAEQRRIGRLVDCEGWCFYLYEVGDVVGQEMGTRTFFLFGVFCEGVDQFEEG
ncbi:hypothetical protein THOM_0735, partial [Trachipleistophora hominis]